MYSLKEEYLMQDMDHQIILREEYADKQYHDEDVYSNVAEFFSYQTYNQYNL